MQSMTESIKSECSDESQSAMSVTESECESECESSCCDSSYAPEVSASAVRVLPPPPLTPFLPHSNRRPLSFPYRYPIEKHAGPMLIPPAADTFCGVCGMCITLEDEQAMLWMTDYNDRMVAMEHVDVGNRELEKLQASDVDVDGNFATSRKFGVMPKAGWTGLYRVVICRTKLPPKRGMPQYHVSGIGRFHLWDSDPRARKMQDNREYRSMYNYQQMGPVFTVPYEKNDLLIDRQHFYNKIIPNDEKDTTTSKPLVKRISVYPAHFHDEKFQEMLPHGFPIHANCWALAERVIGGDKVEKKLDLFIRILQQRWKDEQILTESQAIAEWIIDRSDPWSVFHHFLDNNRSEYDVERNLVAIRDPVHVYEVEEIIAESASKYTRLKEKLGENAFATATVVALTTTTNRVLYTIPWEVWANVFDFLHYRDLTRLLLATRLRMPWSYWQKRAPRDIIWELDEIDSQTTPVDWQYLCLRAERLCEESLGLINRQRICNILNEVGQKLDFFSDVTIPDDLQAEVSNVATATSIPTATPTTQTLSEEEEAVIGGNQPYDTASAEINLYDTTDSEAESGLTEWDDEAVQDDYQAAAEWDQQ